MRSKKFLTAVLAALGILFMPIQAAVADVKVSVGDGSNMSLSGPTMTFTLMDGSGRVLGRATVPASEALGSSLATFFQSVANAIRDVMDAVAAQETGTLSTASTDVWISSKVKLNLSTSGYGATPSSGGGGCYPGVASCN